MIIDKTNLEDIYILVEQGKDFDIRADISIHKVKWIENIFKEFREVQDYLAGLYNRPNLSKDELNILNMRRSAENLRYEASKLEQGIKSKAINKKALDDAWIRKNNG